MFEPRLPAVSCLLMVDRYRRWKEESHESKWSFTDAEVNRGWSILLRREGSRGNVNKQTATGELSSNVVFLKAKLIRQQWMTPTGGLLILVPHHLRTLLPVFAIAVDTTGSISTRSALYMLDNPHELICEKVFKCEERSYKKKSLKHLLASRGFLASECAALHATILSPSHTCLGITT